MNYIVSLAVMEQLAVDIGNSRIKYAVMEDGRIKHSGGLEKGHYRELLRIPEDFPGCRRGIVASVLPREEAFLQEMNNILEKVVWLDEHTPLPFRVLYHTRETLGPDRLAGVAGAYTRFPGSSVMVIDMGTAITVDLLTAEGEYVGGNIAPGMEMRFRALHEYTGKLPLAKPDPGAGVIGQSTMEALSAGVQQGILHETEGYISWGRSQYPDLKAVLTGGDAEFFAKKLKSPIFVDLNLLFTGLDRILTYNAEIVQA